MASASALLLCVAAGVSNATEDVKGSEQFSLYWVQQETALWASLLRPIVISLIFSFFSPHTCNRGSAT